MPGGGGGLGSASQGGQLSGEVSQSVGWGSASLRRARPKNPPPSLFRSVLSVAECIIGLNHLVSVSPFHLAFSVHVGTRTEGRNWLSLCGFYLDIRTSELETERFSGHCSRDALRQTSIQESLNCLCSAKTQRTQI